jgi:hypothetical protein
MEGYYASEHRSKKPLILLSFLVEAEGPIPSATHTQSPCRGVSSAKLTVYRPSRDTMEGYYHEGAYATPSALEGKLASS